jgi:hypothetical protein
MAEILPLRPSEHDVVQKLLPWYVNRTLSEAETQRVEAHFSQCEDCRQDFALERALAADIDMVPLNVDNGWAAMQQRMTDPDDRSVVRSAAVPRRWWSSAGWAAVGALAASVVLALFMTKMQPAPVEQHTYRALGSAGSTARGQVVILFKPETTEQQMRTILERQQARLVDGPTAAGAYVLQIDGGDPAAAITRLRTSDKVVVAEALANDGRP